MAKDVMAWTHTDTGPGPDASDDSAPPCTPEPIRMCRPAALRSASWTTGGTTSQVKQRSAANQQQATPRTGRAPRTRQPSVWTATVKTLLGFRPSMTFTSAQHRRRDIARHDHDPFSRPVQPAGGIRQEDVQVHGGRQHLEQLTDRGPDRVAGERQQREGSDETRGQHQRTEPAHRPTPPRDQPAHQIGNGDPADDQDGDHRVRQVLPGRGDGADPADERDSRSAISKRVRVLGRDGGRRGAASSTANDLSKSDTSVPPRGFSGQPLSAQVTVSPCGCGGQTRNPNLGCTRTYYCRRTLTRSQWDWAASGPSRRAVHDPRSANLVDGQKPRPIDHLSSRGVQMINQYGFEIGVLGGRHPFVRVGKYRPPLVVLPGLTLDYRPPSWWVMSSYAMGFHRLSTARTVFVVQRRRGLHPASLFGTWRMSTPD